MTVGWGWTGKRLLLEARGMTTPAVGAGSGRGLDGAAQHHHVTVPSRIYQEEEP